MCKLVTALLDNISYIYVLSNKCILIGSKSVGALATPALSSEPSLYTALLYTACIIKIHVMLLLYTLYIATYLANIQCVSCHDTTT